MKTALSLLSLFALCAGVVGASKLDDLKTMLSSDSLKAEDYLSHLMSIRNIVEKETEKRKLNDIDTSDFSGLRVDRDDAIIEMGANGDVKLVRHDDDSMIITAKRKIILYSDEVDVTGDLAFGGAEVMSGQDAQDKLYNYVADILGNLTHDGRIACEEGWKGRMCAEDARPPEILCRQDAVIVDVEDDKLYADLVSSELIVPKTIDNGPIKSETDIVVTYQVDELEGMYTKTNSDGSVTWRLDVGKKYSLTWMASDSFGNVGTCVEHIRAGDGCKSRNGEGCDSDKQCIESSSGNFKCVCKEGFYVDRDSGECIAKMCKVKAYLQGAGGASGNYGGWSWGGDGGAGAFARSYFDVPFGEEVLVVAGEGGKPFQNNFFTLGGGGPVSRNKGDNRYCGGGGGASGLWYLTGTNAKTRSVRRQITQAQYSNQFTQESTITMAGAGGGGGAMSGGSRDYMWGGAGGTSNGQNAAGNGYYGKGGTQTGCQGNNGGGGQCGIKFTGGAGSPGDSYGGGGGGGWWGGSGAQHTNPMAGGGGGSSRITSCTTSQGCPATSGQTWVAGSRLNKGQDPEKSSHYFYDKQIDEDTGKVKYVKTNPVHYWFDGVGQGGTGNGRPGENGRVVVVVNNWHEEPFVYESGSHIFKCDNSKFKLDE